VLEERLYASKEAFVGSGHCECQTLLRGCLHRGGGAGSGFPQLPRLVSSLPGKYPGDALWALMVFCGLGFVNPGLSALRLADYTLLISYVDEFSQIYRAPWIDAVRSTYVGHLILGSTFSWYDMLAYTVGVAFGVVCRTIAVYPYWRRRPSG